MDPQFYKNLLEAPLDSYYPAIKGGALLALATTIYYALFGGILGMSGLAGSIVKFPTRHSTKLKGIILMGMLCAAAMVLMAHERSKPFRNMVQLPFDKKSSIDESSMTVLALAGLLVGVGTELSNGCTSGHGLCGMSRLSLRSIVAVLAFLGTAIATATFSLKTYIPEIHLLQLPQYENISIPAEYYLYFSTAMALLLTLTERQKSILAKLALFIIGIIFGCGLMLAGMSKRDKIFGFLQLSSSWDPSLLFVLMTGVLINALTFSVIRSLGKNPVFGEKMENPHGKVNFKLVVGAVLFGLGWGIGGLCPGPFILSIPYSLKLTVYWGVPFFLGQKVSNVCFGEGHPFQGKHHKLT